MSSKLYYKIQGMGLNSATQVMNNYKNNGKELTDAVKEAYWFCHGLGMKSYSFMEILVGKEIAKEILELDKRI